VAAAKETRTVTYYESLAVVSRAVLEKIGDFVKFVAALWGVGHRHIRKERGACPRQVENECAISATNNVLRAMFGDAAHQFESRAAYLEGYQRAKGVAV